MITIQGFNSNAAASGQISSNGFVTKTSCNYVLHGVLITGSAQMSCSSGPVLRWPSILKVTFKPSGKFFQTLLKHFLRAVMTN
jgi:hypothetical protein